jgi:transcriptional pleiotropic regulator of transition state genes
MKSTGIVRKIDDLGRIVVPMEIRKTFGIENGDPLEIFVDGDQVILKQYSPGCVFCGAVEDSMTKCKGKPICKQCYLLLKRGFTLY